MKPSYEQSGFKKQYEDQQIVREDDSPMNRKVKKTMNKSKTRNLQPMKRLENAVENNNGQTDLLDKPVASFHKKSSTFDISNVRLIDSRKTAQ